MAEYMRTSNTRRLAYDEVETTVREYVTDILDQLAASLGWVVGDWQPDTMSCSCGELTVGFVTIGGSMCLELASWEDEVIVPVSALSHYDLLGQLQKLASTDQLEGW